MTMKKEQSQSATAEIYQIKNWEEHFEGAKSKTYKNKTSCSMPTKHGLGYKKMVKSHNGSAIFGAWCALVQVLSRHASPRQGYCTDTGRIEGSPYTDTDLEILTDIPADIFSAMFFVAESIGWVDVIKAKDTTRNHTDTTGDCQGTLVPLNSDLDSNLNSDLDSDSFFVCLKALKENPSFETAIKAVYASNDSFKTVGRMHIENALKEQPDKTKWHDAISGMAAKFAGVEMQFPNNSLKNWLAGKPDNKPTLRQIQRVKSC